MRRWCGAIVIALGARMAGAQASDPFASAVRALLVSRGETDNRPVEQAALEHIYGAVVRGLLSDDGCRSARPAVARRGLVAGGRAAEMAEGAWYA